MAIIDKLASSLGRRDEVPNQELAKEVAERNDKKAVAELIALLDNKNKGIQNDSIKVLYEIGEQNPMLIAGYHDTFIKLLGSKNNRMQWGAMTALRAIAAEKPDELFKALPLLLDVAEKGTVITKDSLMAIMVKLGTVKKYNDDVFALYNEQLQQSLPNQFPMYAENAFPIINEKNKAAFIKTLTDKLPETNTDAKRKRVEKVIKKLTK